MNRISRATYYLFCIAIFAAAFNASGQTARVTDSLKHAILSHTTDDSNKALLIAGLAHSYHLLNSDSELIYARQAYELSHTIKFTQGKIVALEAMGSAKFQAGQYDSALACFNAGMQLCYNAADHREGCVLLNNIANTFFRQGKYNDALNYYDSAVVCAEKVGNLEIQGKALSNIGSIFYQMGNYTHALKNYLAGLKIQEKKNNAAAIAGDLSNIANVYFRLFQYDKAAEYTRRSMELNEKTGARHSIITNLTTYAMIFDAEKKYDSSLLSLQKALVLARETKDVFTENIINSNIAECYLKKGEFDKALSLYAECITISEKLGDAEGIAIAKTGAGQTLLKQNRTAEGIRYLKEALVTIEQLGLKEQALTATNSLAQAYETAGDYKQALDFYKLNHSYRDSINRNKGKQEAQQLVFNYELQKKEEIIDLLKRNEDIQTSKDRIKSLLLYTFLLGFSMMAILAFLFSRNLRKLRRSRELLKQQKDEMELLAKKLQDLNDFKDNTFNVLSHDLRSPVNALTSAMMLLDEKLITPDEFAMHRHELNSKLQAVSLLLENMLYWARSQMKGEQTLNIEKLDVKRKSLKVLAVLKDAAHQKDINLSLSMPEHVHAYADKNQFDIILRNLVSNAIKFTPAKGTIVISAEEDGRLTHISVTDNGVGMSEEQVTRLFANSNHASTEGTSGERGTGLGLQLSNKFARNNGGEIKVSSVKGKGTTFTLTLPNQQA